MDLSTDQRRGPGRKLLHQTLTKLRTLPLAEARALLDVIRSDTQGLAALDEWSQGDSGASSGPPQSLDTVMETEQLETASSSATPEASTSHGSSGASSNAAVEMSHVDGTQLEKLGTRHQRLILPDSPLEKSPNFHRLSQVMLSFREAAASKIISDGSANEILSMSGLRVDLLYRKRLANDGHPVSTWACEFARASKVVAPVSQLTVVYFAGAFMRWLIIPCKETYDLLPPLMRPMVQKSMTYNPFEVESYNTRAWEWIDNLTLNKTRLQWPYTALACLDEMFDPSLALLEPRKSFSVLFTDHCNDMKNWTMSGEQPRRDSFQMTT
ncbi:uncharacterized protein AB675_10758 [Cyphellophora attinorum]|uniref:Uncharacterized protein n=1 Tax=Cyphellophora attinorum TaxID=1664694 RepID=A0A0N1HBJ6_9EURO|nr:uncharacterized protein AB675_10758 [Phialophora attinorum]KPI40775.1 hypothetical protein AB675_10758 [Phialophora attinorum]